MIGKMLHLLTHSLCLPFSFFLHLPVLLTFFGGLISEVIYFHLTNIYSALTDEAPSSGESPLCRANVQKVYGRLIVR